ncbi:MAG: ABC transporter permease [Hyphomicrobiaceae bacterium]|nr:ABC transporter permease [Hyphomicrobiaceae bacterium]
MRITDIAGGPAIPLALAAVAFLAVAALGRLDLMKLAAVIVLIVAACIIALRLVHRSDVAATASYGFTALVVGLWLAAWMAVDAMAAWKPRSSGVKRLFAILVPALFGAFLFFLWEVSVVGAGIPLVLMPSLSAIAAAFMKSTGTLWADFVQTFVRSVIPGWLMGCGAGFVVAIIADRVPFLRRGLIPLGNLVSALPIIGIAPILVMWFGFDWHSKAAVVVVMTFFPMLVNTIAGLGAANALERDLMRSYGASYIQTLTHLRLPAAMPFVFNALKINSTLALIGAIVAEFFGTPIVGMGFRISTEVGRVAFDMVWASIAVAAVAGSTSYGLLALLERAVTFWHPSYRAR